MIYADGPGLIPCNDQTCEERHECAQYSEETHPRWRGYSKFPWDIPISDPCPWFADREAA